MCIISKALISKIGVFDVLANTEMYAKIHCI